MLIQIKSREQIEAMHFDEGTALISITDAEYDFAELISKPDYILQIAFDDVDNDVMIDELGREPTEDERKRIEAKYHMLTDEQAKQIAEFYASVCDKAETLICQCEHGQSRSAAIAAAVLEYRHGNGIKVFASDRYYPNKVVFRKVLSQLKTAK